MGINLRLKQHRVIGEGAELVVSIIILIDKSIESDPIDLIMINVKEKHTIGNKITVYKCVDVLRNNIAWR